MGPTDTFFRTLDGLDLHDLHGVLKWVMDAFSLFLSLSLMSSATKWCKGGRRNGFKLGQTRSGRSCFPTFLSGFVPFCPSCKNLVGYFGSAITQRCTLSESRDAPLSAPRSYPQEGITFLRLPLDLPILTGAELHEAAIMKNPRQVIWMVGHGDTWKAWTLPWFCL